MTRHWGGIIWSTSPSVTWRQRSAGRWVKFRWKYLGRSHQCSPLLERFPNKIYLSPIRRNTQSSIHSLQNSSPFRFASPSTKWYTLSKILSSDELLRFIKCIITWHLTCNLIYHSLSNALKMILQHFQNSSLNNNNLIKNLMPNEFRVFLFIWNRRRCKPFARVSVWVCHCMRLLSSSSLHTRAVALKRQRRKHRLYPHILAPHEHSPMNDERWNVRSVFISVVS